MELRGEPNGNTLEAKLIVSDSSWFTNETSREIVINGAVVFQMRFLARNNLLDYHRPMQRKVSVHFRRRRANDDTVYNIKFTSNELGVRDQYFTSDDAAWHVVYDSDVRFDYCNVIVKINVPSPSSVASPRDNTTVQNCEQPQENRIELKGETIGNTLNAKLTVKENNTSCFYTISREIVINDAVEFRVKLISVHGTFNNYTSWLHQMSVQFMRHCMDEDVTYNIKFTSDELRVKDKCFTSDDGTWHIVYESSKEITYCNFVVHIRVPSASSFVSLHDDTELTDFELRGKDGSVHVHRTVLATASPVLRRMLSGEWRETREGHVNLPSTSRVTLQHLKNYVYLQTLPDTGLEELLLLASCYDIPDLEQNCLDKLVRSVNATNTCDLIEFATMQKMTKLLLAVLERVQSGAVKVTDISNCLTKQ